MKKRIWAIALAIIFCVGGVIGSLMLTDDTNADSKAKAEKETVVVVEDEATVDDEAKDEEAVADENKEASKGIATAEKKDTVKSDTKKDTTVKKDTSKKETVKKEDSNKDNSKPAKKEESNKSNTESKPKHTHSWTAVYKEVDNGYYKTVTTKQKYYYCSDCGVDITYNSTAHFKEHKARGEYGSSAVAGYRYIESQEWVPKIEKVVDYYKCSCGATK